MCFLNTHSICNNLPSHCLLPKFNLLTGSHFPNYPWAPYLTRPACQTKSGERLGENILMKLNILPWREQFFTSTREAFMPSVDAVSKLSWKANTCFHPKICYYLDHHLNRVQKAFKKSDVSILQTWKANRTTNFSKISYEVKKMAYETPNNFYCFLVKLKKNQKNHTNKNQPNKNQTNKTKSNFFFLFWINTFNVQQWKEEESKRPRLKLGRPFMLSVLHQVKYSLFWMQSVCLLPIIT